MKWRDIQHKGEEELTRELSQARGKMVELGFGVQSGSLKQVHLVGLTRKLISRILTRLHQIKKEGSNTKK
jgi:ribosomal protein L29